MSTDTDPMRETLKQLVGLWRQRENNDEPMTDFDKGYEQASDECAEVLERALAALDAPQLTPAPTREATIPPGLLSELGTVAARLEMEGSEGYAASVREAGEIIAALAAAPQPDKRLVWIIENTSQVRVRDLAMDILNHPKATAPGKADFVSDEHGTSDWTDPRDKQPAPADREALAEVKPLDWHKSHMPNWNGDYHTVPTGYSVRCADENGWKWSGLGAHGYRSTPSAAKGEAQADHERRILSQIVARPSLAGDERVARLVEVSDRIFRILENPTASVTIIEQMDLRAALSAMNTPAQGGEDG